MSARDDHVDRNVFAAPDTLPTDRVSTMTVPATTSTSVTTETTAVPMGPNEPAPATATATAPKTTTATAKLPQPVPVPVTPTLGGEAVELHGERALYWPARRRLLIADLHLGKADAFRRAGIALPAGGSAHDLARIGALLEATGAREFWVLGDLLHGALTDTHWRGQWDAWRARHAAVEVAILTGNHDRALAAAGLDVVLLGDAVDDGPFALRHAPDDAPATRDGTPALHTLCGHLHPVVRMPGLGRRLPAFWLRPGITVLPAFSAFTGGVPIDPAAGETLVACAGGEAILLPPSRRLLGRR